MILGWGGWYPAGIIWGGLPTPPGAASLVSEFAAHMSLP
jgi:hypothetical protein